MFKLWLEGLGVAIGFGILGFSCNVLSVWLLGPTKGLIIGGIVATLISSIITSWLLYRKKH